MYALGRANQNIPSLNKERKILQSTQIYSCVTTCRNGGGARESSCIFSYKVCMQCRMSDLVGVYIHICTHVNTYAGFLWICRAKHKAVGFPARAGWFHAIAAECDAVA